MVFVLNSNLIVTEDRFETLKVYLKMCDLECSQGNQDAKTEQDSTRNIVARQLRPRAIKYN